MHISLAFIFLLIQYTIIYSQMMYPNIISIGLNKPLKTIWILPDYYLNVCNENIQSVSCSSHKNSSPINNLELQKFCNVLSYSSFVYKRINLTTETYHNCCQIIYMNGTFEKACYIDSMAFMNFFTIQVLQIKSFLIKNPSGLLNDGNIKKYLPIPSGPLAFSLLIDLQDQFQVFYIILRLLPPWPGLIDFEKRIPTTANSDGDFGEDWQWEKLDIMSLSCMPPPNASSFNSNSSTHDHSSTNKLFPSECRAKSSIRKSVRGEVKIINIANIMQQSLARWIKITFWRNSDLTLAQTDQFYNIPEISIVGRCVCNGRASSCTLTSFPYACNCTRDRGLIYADSNKCITEDEDAWNSMDSTDDRSSNFSSVTPSRETIEKEGAQQAVRARTWLHGLQLNNGPQQKNRSEGGEVNLRFLWKGVGDKLVPYYPNTTTTKVEYYGNLSSYNQKIIEDYLKTNGLPPNVVDFIDFTRPPPDYNAKEGVAVNYFDNPTTSTFVTVKNITGNFADEPVTTTIFPTPHNTSQLTFQHFDIMAYGSFEKDFFRNGSYNSNYSLMNGSSHLNSSHAENSLSTIVISDEAFGLGLLFNNTDQNFATVHFSPASRYNNATEFRENITKAGVQLLGQAPEAIYTNYGNVRNFSTESWINSTTEPPTGQFKTDLSHLNNFSTTHLVPITKITDNQSINTSNRDNETISTFRVGVGEIITKHLPSNSTTTTTFYTPSAATKFLLNVTSRQPDHELTNIPQTDLTKSQSSTVQFSTTSHLPMPETMKFQFKNPLTDLGVPLLTNQPLGQTVLAAWPGYLLRSNAFLSSLMGQPYNATSWKVLENAVAHSRSFKNPQLYNCLQLSRNQIEFWNSTFDAKLCFDAFLSLDYFPNNPNDKTWFKRFQTPINSQNLDFWKIFLLLSALNSDKVNPTTPVFSRQSSFPSLEDPMRIEVEAGDSNDYSLPIYRQVWFTVALSFLAFCALVCFFLAMLRKHKYRVIEWYPAKLNDSIMVRNVKSPLNRNFAMPTSSLYGTVNGHPRTATKYRNTSVNGAYQKRVNADVHQLYGLENPNFNYDEIIMYDFEDNDAIASSPDSAGRSVRQLYSIPETRI